MQKKLLIMSTLLTLSIFNIKSMGKADGEIPRASANARSSAQPKAAAQPAEGRTVDADLAQIRDLMAALGLLPAGQQPVRTVSSPALPAARPPQQAQPKQRSASHASVQRRRTASVRRPTPKRNLPCRDPRFDTMKVMKEKSTLERKDKDMEKMIAKRKQELADLEAKQAAAKQREAELAGILAAKEASRR